MNQSDRAQIEREVRQQIVRRMRIKLGFSWHAAVFAVANAAMIAINVRFTPNTLWCVWPLGAWGVGLLFHAFAAFGGGSLSEAEIQAQVQAELARRGLS
ncbi:MAG: 2TM domain-containing protein [Myxococcales bacterium]